jgi:hypothetical protein
VSPALFEREPLRQPSDIANHVLLMSETHPGDWADWLERAGLPHRTEQRRRVFDHFFVTLQTVARAKAPASAGHATTSREPSPDKASTQSLEAGADRPPYFKWNSGGLVIFGWNCALQDISSQASHISALRLIASGK